MQGSADPEHGLDDNGRDTIRNGDLPSPGSVIGAGPEGRLPSRGAICPLCNEGVTPGRGASYMDGWHHTSCLDKHMGRDRASAAPYTEHAGCMSACRQIGEWLHEIADHYERIRRAASHQELRALAYKVENDEIPALRGRGDHD